MRAQDEVMRLLKQLGCKQELLLENKELRETNRALEAETQNLHGEIRKWREQARSLYTLLDTTEIAAPHHEFIGTVVKLSYRDEGLNIIFVVQEGKKRIRYVIDKEGYELVKFTEGERLRVEAGNRPVTFPGKHQPNGFIQCSPVLTVEIL